MARTFDGSLTFVVMEFARVLNNNLPAFKKSFGGKGSVSTKDAYQLSITLPDCSEQTVREHAVAAASVIKERCGKKLKLRFYELECPTNIERAETVFDKRAGVSARAIQAWHPRDGLVTRIDVCYKSVA